MFKNYYIDMDGVTVEYDRDAYIGDEPLFMKKGHHYFRDLKPDFKMLEVIDKLFERSRYTQDQIYILTSICNNGAIFNEHFHDKVNWLHKWMPYIDIDHILISVTSKRDAVEYIHNHKLTTNDILIDDYNKNLKDWTVADGTAIKYCNGINTPASFDGIKIYKADTTDNILSVIMAAGEE